MNSASLTNQLITDIVRALVVLHFMALIATVRGLARGTPKQFYVVTVVLTSTILLIHAFWGEMMGARWLDVSAAILFICVYGCIKTLLERDTDKME